MAKPRRGRGPTWRWHWLAGAAWLVAQSGCTVICIDGNDNRVQDAGGHGKISVPQIRPDDGHAPHRDGGRVPPGR